VIRIITTSDGSHSLLNTELDETYHSRHGALQESLHVFIKNGLEVLDLDEINIFEVGFGTGLNALLAAQSNKKINYTSIEAFPLPEEVYSQLNYEPRTLLQDLHRAAWNFKSQILNLSLTKLHTTLEAVQLPPNHFNIIFFDAFAPSKQPSMWELPMLKKVCDSLTQGGLFVTYCAKGQLKRDLRSLGLEVETLPGPPGKKEMVRARKL